MPIILAIVLIIAAALGGSAVVSYTQQVNKTVPTIAPEVPVTTLTPVPVLNPGAQVDSDPIIECQNPNCGPIYIKKSLCSNIVGYVCCQVGNTWTWYASRNKCTQDQKNYQENQRIKNTSGVLSPDEKIPCTLSSGTYTVSRSTCESMRLSETNYTVCKMGAETKLNSCKTNCNNTNNSNRDICLTAFGTSSPYGYNDEKLGECFNEIGDIYGKCLDECSNNFSSDLHKCAP